MDPASGLSESQTDGLHPPTWRGPSVRYVTPNAQTLRLNTVAVFIAIALPLSKRVDRPMLPSPTAERAIASGIEPIAATCDVDGKHVVARLHGWLRQAARVGYTIRQEATGGGTVWCQIRGQMVLFVDTQQTAGEQIAAIQAILRDGLTAARRPPRNSPTPG